MFLSKKKKEAKNIRFWDFSNANKFLKTYRDDIEYMSLELFEDENINPEVFVEDGNLVNTFNGKYQMGFSSIDGVVYTCKDIPCIHVIYKGGKEEYLACYFDTQVNESYAFSHRKLR